MRLRFLMFIPLLYFLIRVIVKLFIMNFELAGLTAISPVFFACFVGDTTKQYLRKFILTCISVVVEVDFMSLIRYIYVEYINQAFSVCTQANKKDCRSSPKRCG